MKNTLEAFNTFIDTIYSVNGSTSDSATKTITFQVTDDCCCACTYCYQINKGHKTMTKEVGKAIIDLIFHEREKETGYLVNKKTEGIVLDFIGGEPLMNIDVIDYICTYFLDQCLEKNDPWLTKCRFSIISNGKYYFEPKVQNFLKKFQDFLSFDISIDGPQEIHDACRVYHDGTGNFKDAYAALKHFTEHYDQPASTKITISRDNIYNISKLAKFFVEELNIKDLNANCIFEEEWTYDDAKVFYQELKNIADYMLNREEDDIYFSRFEEHIGRPMLITDNRNYCGGTGSTIAFNPEGIAYPCLRYQESSLGNEQPPLIIGNIKDGLYQRESDKKTIEMLKTITRRSQCSDECFYCVVASGCAWCSAWNYQETGTPNKRSTRICPMHKANVLANYYYWNQYYRKNNIYNRKNIILPKNEALKIISEEEYQMLVNLAQYEGQNKSNK